MYGDPIPVKELADHVASYVHLCILKPMMVFFRNASFILYEVAATGLGRV